MLFGLNGPRVHRIVVGAVVEPAGPVENWGGIQPDQREKVHSRSPKGKLADPMVNKVIMEMCESTEGVTDADILENGMVHPIYDGVHRYPHPSPS